jgi:hypothetical protein
MGGIESRITKHFTSLRSAFLHGRPNVLPTPLVSILATILLQKKNLPRRRFFYMHGDGENRTRV